MGERQPRTPLLSSGAGQVTARMRQVTAQCEQYSKTSPVAAPFPQPIPGRSSAGSGGSAQIL